MVLKDDWVSGEQFNADDQNDVAAAINNVATAVGINVREHGVTGDGTTNDSTAIQAVIDAARDAVRAGYGAPAVVVFPAGIYRLNSGIVQPPYVKVMSAGSVTFESYVSADSAWRIAPLSDDPSDLYAPLDKNQWFTGPLLNGADGGITFVNRYGTPATSAALELGPRSDLGHPMARYKVNDIAIQGYERGIRWNAYNHYICSYHRIDIENCRKAVVTSSTGTDAGENISWHACNFSSTIASDGVSVGTDPLFTWDAANAIDMSFFACSFDYATTVFKFNQGYQKVFVFGGHMETINVGSRLTSTGGIAVSDVVSGNYPELTLVALPFVQYERGTHFRGNMNLNVDLAIRADTSELRYTEAYLCDSTVNVLKTSYQGYSSGPSVARQCNLTRDSLIAADATSTAGSALTHWARSSFGTVTDTVDADSPVAGGKCMKVLMTGSAGVTYTSKTYLPCTPRDRILAKMAYKFSAATPAATLQGFVTWYDSEKVSISSANSEMFRASTLVNTWAVPNGHREFIAPEGACFFKLGFQVSTSAGDGVVTYRLSDFHAFMANS